MKPKFLIISVVVLTLVMALAGCANQQNSGSGFASIPAGKAFAEGQEIYFSHTEVSDAQLAEKLTQMMKSPVLYVPSLSSVPEEATSAVYVFENGVKGKGPLGFQSDVFDNPPGTTGYTPLRRIILVKWLESATPAEIRSAVDIMTAETNGELTLQKTDIVVNMPFMVWADGKR
ncbi:MAG: hypothetical protein FD147_1410 [Chloroflexi bacterium]|nr:MAG: hypothetical protein FD147_1410 [Chloroflexota bacterium]MBA4374981.1 hypothetical protein [Anaerolinea sp.]